MGEDFSLRGSNGREVGVLPRSVEVTEALSRSQVLPGLLLGQSCWTKCPRLVPAHLSPHL